MDATALAPVLTATVSPMLVISAAGLLLLSMTNRYGRVIDRARAYRNQLAAPALDTAAHAATLRHLSIVWRRARLLRLAISLLILAVLGICLTVLGLFLHLIGGWIHGVIILALFGLSLGTMAVGLVLFVRDMGLSLRALEEEIGEIPGLAATCQPDRR